MATKPIKTTKPVTLTNRQLDYALNELHKAAQLRTDLAIKALGERPPAPRDLEFEDKIALIFAKKAKMKTQAEITKTGDYTRFTNAFDYTPDPGYAKTKKVYDAWTAKRVAAIDRVEAEKKAIERQLVMGSDGAAALALIEAFRNTK